MGHQPRSRRRALSAALCVTLAWATACSSEDGGSGDEGADDAGAADVPQSDIIPIEDIGGGGGADVGESQDVGGFDVAGLDAGGDDSLTGPLCPGDEGCACDENAECDNGLCIDGPDGRVCAITCIDDCPEGSRCTQVSTPNGDTVSYCAPRWLMLCAPCDSSISCGSTGDNQAVCVAQGNAGAYCATSCKGESDCPEGYDCQAAFSVEGLQQTACVPTATGDGDAPCGCNTFARQSQLGTTCTVTTTDEQGNVIGACEGSRFCDADGLTACLAPDPQPEICDGIDNNCNGQVDEGTCDDFDPCTKDACLGASGVCGHEPTNEGGPCDDDDPCTLGDKCKGGDCEGKALDCDDDNPCTQGVCDLAGGCTQVSADGLPCSDGDPCTVGDKCATGDCAPGAPKLCKSSKVCINSFCDADTGACIGAAAADGVPCDDGSECTAKDSCKAGVCVGEGLACDDGNPCTNDTCDANGGCAYVAIGGPCDDGDLCTKVDTCKDGACAGSQPLLCDDANPCTDDGCSPASGCVHNANGAPCDDGNACTPVDGCQDKACVGLSAKVCKDANPCTADTCDPQTGECLFDGGIMTGQPCEGVQVAPCSNQPLCDQGTCLAPTQKDCDDGNPCTLDKCNAQTGCVYLEVPDNTVCADGKTCVAGLCGAAPTCGDGLLNQAFEQCDDGNKADGDGCSKSCKLQGPLAEQILVLGGAFQMGCNPGESPPCTNADGETPYHTVQLSSYFIDKREVTVAQYELCVFDGACSLPGQTHASVANANYQAPDRGKHPINYVDWGQAKAYCEWAGGSRLCTEAEWEYAARGFDERKYPWGNDPVSCERAHIASCGPTTRPVAETIDGVSPFGVFDMSGNVAEWVYDVFDKDFYAASPLQNPDGPDPGQSPATAERVFRGGGYTNFESQVRASARAKQLPAFVATNIGIRCCRSPN